MTGAIYSEPQDDNNRNLPLSRIRHRANASVVDWCVGVYRTRADIPLMAQSTLNTFAPRMEEAVDEAKQSIDRALDNQHPKQGN